MLFARSVSWYLGQSDEESASHLTFLFYKKKIMLDAEEEDKSKTFYKLITPYILVIFLFNLIEGISIYETIYFVNNLNFSLFLVSLIFGFSSLARLLVEIPTGILGDNIGNKFNVLFGAFCLLLGFLLIISGTFFTVILGMIFIGIGDAFWITSLNASAINYIKYNGHYNIDKFFTVKNIVVSLGYLVGISVNMFLIKHFGMIFIYYFAVIVALLIMFFSYYLLPNDYIKTGFTLLTFKTAKFKEDLIESIKYIKKQKILLVIALSMLVLSIGIEGFYNFIYLYFNKLGLQQKNIGILSYMETIISFFIPFIGLLFFKIFKYVDSLIIFMLFAGISLFLFVLITNLKLNFIWYALFFTFLQLYHLTKDILIHKNIEKNRSTIESSLNVIESVGEVIGGFLFGFLIYSFGFKASFILISLLFICMAGFLIKGKINQIVKMLISRLSGLFKKLFFID